MGCMVNNLETAVVASGRLMTSHLQRLASAKEAVNKFIYLLSYVCNKAHLPEISYSGKSANAKHT